MKIDEEFKNDLIKEVGPLADRAMYFFKGRLILCCYGQLEDVTDINTGQEYIDPIKLENYDKIPGDE